MKLLQIEKFGWSSWLEGLFKMRKLPRKKPWVSTAMLQKNNRGTHGLEPMNNFKLGSLMQKHELKEEIINDFDESE